MPDEQSQLQSEKHHVKVFKKQNKNKKQASNSLLRHYTIYSWIPKTLKSKSNKEKKKKRVLLPS